MPARMMIAMAMLLMVGLVPVALQSNGEDNKNKGVLFPDGREYDYGKVKQGRVVKHAFRIVNCSDVPLRFISARKNCSALTSLFSKETLGANEEATLNVAVDTRRFCGLRSITLYLKAEQGGVTRDFRFWITGISVPQP